MPRDGSNIYSQPFPDVVEDTTIESTVYNGFTNDVAQDLNAPRPIVAGGTGATNADQALFNLAAEKSTQTVTDFNSHIWVPGSFRHVATPTDVGQPVANHAFAGWCYINEALANPPTNQNVIVHAYDFDALANTAYLYTRQKKAGVWSNWNVTTTADNQASARQTIYAAPFDALAYNGMQVNGSMEVSQAIGTGIVGPGFNVDGWSMASGGPQVINAQQVTVAPAGYSNSLQLWVGTANAAPTAAHLTWVSQNIEGYRTIRLGWGAANPQPITIGFWVFATRTGIFSGSVRNAASNRSFVFSYTVNATNTWEYKTASVPGDATGTWLKTNDVGISLSFAMMSGTTYATAPGAWTAGNFIAATGQVNCVASTSDALMITGVVVLPGIEAPSAARSSLIMRPYDQELLACQRYFYIQGGEGPFQYFGKGRVSTATTASITLAPTVIMRASPTVAVSNVAHLALSTASGTIVGLTGIVLDQASTKLTAVNISGASGLVAGNATDLLANNTSAARIYLDARL